MQKHLSMPSTVTALIFIGMLGLVIGLPVGKQRTLQGRYVGVVVGAGECDPLTHGAKGDGKTDDTKAAQAAIDECAKDGGRVTFKSGHTFLIYSLHVTGSNVELHIESGCTLLASDDFKSWKSGDVGSAIIVAQGVEHVAITGGGTVDGQGLSWWREMKKPGQGKMFRPHTVDFKHVTHGMISQTTFKHGPNHILELGCDHCEISYVNVLNPPSTGSCKDDNSCSHNTDAVDVHGTPFYVHNVNFTTGDDNIASHANHTLVEDSYFGSGHGASIGSLCNDWLTNITFRNITFVGTSTAARIKSHPGCGGHVWDVTWEDLTLHNVPQSIDLTQFYFASSKPPPSTYRFDATIKNLVSYGGGSGFSGNDGRRRRKGGGGGDHSLMNFNCDTHYDGKHNCFVKLDNVAHYDVKGESGMFCHGVTGTANNITGVTNCIQ